MTDFNIKVTVRNAHLLRALRNRFASVAEAARCMGVHQSKLNALVTMKESPLRRDGSLTPLAEQVCDFLGVNFEELWPGKLAEMRRKKASHEVEISIAEMARLADPTQTALDRKMLASWATTLKPRELQVIGMRLEGATLDECGEELGVSRERLRQIEAKAHRKMRAIAARQGVKSFEDAVK